MPSRPRFYSDVYVELEREGGRQVLLDYDTYSRLPVEQLANTHARLFARDERGEKVYLTGGLEQLVAAAQAHRIAITPVLHGRRAPRGQS